MVFLTYVCWIATCICLLILATFVGFFSTHRELKRKDSRSFFSHTTRTSPPVDQKVKALQLCDPWHPHVFHVINPSTSPRDGWTSNICDVYVDVYPNPKRFPPEEFILFDNLSLHSFLGVQTTLKGQPETTSNLQGLKPFPVCFHPPGAWHQVDPLHRCVQENDECLGYGEIGPTGLWHQKGNTVVNGVINHVHA